MQTRAQSGVSTRLLKVGMEIFPVYGDESTGWSMNAEDFLPSFGARFRYESLDELFFALLNLNMSEEGCA